jgi:hypothetical protein
MSDSCAQGSEGWCSALTCSEHELVSVCGCEPGPVSAGSRVAASAGNPRCQPVLGETAGRSVTSSESSRLMPLACRGQARAERRHSGRRHGRRVDPSGAAVKNPRGRAAPPFVRRLRKRLDPKHVHIDVADAAGARGAALGDDFSRPGLNLLPGSQKGPRPFASSQTQVDST